MNDPTPPTTASPAGPARTVPLPVLAAGGGAGGPGGPGAGGAVPTRGSAAALTAKSIALRLYRLAVIVAIVWMVYRQHARLRVDGGAPIEPAEVRQFLPAASRLEVDTSDRLGLFVLDAAGGRVGYVLRTAPLSDKITGYAGPTDTLVVLDAGMKVLGIRVRSSWDTVQHVRDVVADDYFMETWNGKTWDEVAGMDPAEAGIEGVSGASLTSMAIANGIRNRFRHSVDASSAVPPPPRFGAQDVGVVLVLTVALVFTFTHLRSRTWLRRTFQFMLIGYLGFWNGQLLAMSLLGGWAATSIPWRTAPGLVLLAAAALVLPWASRRPIYCSHVCPHGAAQELVGRVSRWRPRVPAGVERGLRWLPPMLVVLVLIVTMLSVPLELAGIEPFDAYLIRTAGVATICVAVLGLVAAAFVPMAYCKYGCPTGLVLNFVRSHGRADRFGRRDVVAGLIVAFVAVLYMNGVRLHQLLHG